MDDRSNENDEINKLLKLLENELNDFKTLIKDMLLIESPYKNEFNYIYMVMKIEETPYRISSTF